MADPGRPFSVTEMQILRGLIDDRIRQEQRRTKLWHRLSLGERAVVTGWTVLVGVLPLVNLYLNLTRKH